MEPKMRASLAVLHAFNLLTPMQTQMFTVALPVALVHALHYSPSVIGLLLLVMVLGVLVASALQPRLLSFLSPAQYFRRVLALRAAANLLHALALTFLDARPPLLLLLFLSRFAHGLTLGAAAVSLAWIGVHVPADARRGAIAQLQGFLLVGSLLGLLAGGLLSAITSDLTLAAAAPGYATAALSLVQIGALHAFDDRGLLPSAPPPAADGKAAPPPPAPPAAAVLMAILATVQCASFALEPTIALLVYDAYGWRPEEAAAYVFLPLMLLKIGAQFGAPPLLRRVSDGALFGGLCALSAAAALFLVHWQDLSAAVSRAWFLLGILLVGVDGLSITLHSSILSQKLPPELQVKVNTRTAILTQIGRALTPALGSAVYAGLSASAGPGWAFNGVCLVSVFFLLAAHLLGLLHYKALYTAPPPAVMI